MTAVANSFGESDGKLLFFLSPEEKLVIFLPRFLIKEELMLGRRPRNQKLLPCFFFELIFLGSPPRENLLQIFFAVDGHILMKQRNPVYNVKFKAFSDV